MSVTAVILPKLGLTMDEGTLVAWLKREGDAVRAGEILFEVETDKSIMEVEAPASGYVRSLLVAAGATVPVAEVVALIATTADEPVEAPAGSRAWAGTPDPEPAPAEPAPAEPAPAEPANTVTADARPRGDGDRIVASPAARKRAAELGVDLVTVTASKADRISIEDVEAAYARTAGRGGEAAIAAVRAVAAVGAVAAVPGTPETTRIPLSRMRRAIADRMTASFRDVPQFSLSRDVDMTAASQARTAAAVSYADVLIWATARTLRDHPILTMRYDGDGLVAGPGIHLGLAVALEAGLIVPVLRDADRKDLAEIARDRVALQEGARAGKLALEALSGAVFTISNLGGQGVDRFTAIVNPPEAAILAVGRVHEQAVVRDGAVAVAPVVTLTLSVDHRVADGAQAAAFLADLAMRLEQGLR